MRCQFRDKDSANRAEDKINLFIFHPEVQPIFDSFESKCANRAEDKINLFIFHPEVQPIFDSFESNSCR